MKKYILHADLYGPIQNAKYNILILVPSKHANPNSNIFLCDRMVIANNIVAC